MEDVSENHDSLVFGGAFDPPHLGHLALIETAARLFRPKEILIIPTGDATHKQINSPAEMRFRLAQIAFASLPETKVLRLELDRKEHCYTIDTLRYLERFTRGIKLIIGGDQLIDFLKWKEPDEILKLATLGVGKRTGINSVLYEEAIKFFPHPERVSVFEFPCPEMSSTIIRTKLRQGESVNDFVSEAVLAEIERLCLYQS